ncbi:Beta-barrel assembly machine subunit BamC [Noviherbaspirillum humi]|uniref:Beta-barrel assembly machine subunit BamC n=1 Tax=Noviherbaspirillum humi TaxID=1688639 RepID=A0A239DAD7_9BURK|nr:outer membrane protein assembly factor BamC [Noviherbaspirillum humi]SNS29038.1 Beta-barrel assembly machine subunit BamC [Noviherbaspirillum humi]
MTKQSKTTVAQRGLAFALAAGLAGCSSIGSMLEPDRIDYKSAGTVKTPSLEVPPDLTQLQRDNRYSIPEAARGTATASSYSQQQVTRPAATVAPAVMPVAGAASAASAPNATNAASAANGMRIERAGNQRWLVVKQSPEVLWEQVKEFWQDSGFLINSESQQTGIMETDWAENRAKIPQDFLRRTLGKALDSLYSTGERDKFRTRFERTPDGGAEIYISHRGALEVINSQKDSTTWTPRPADPELEAEFLSRLMVRLGEDTNRAKATVVNAPAQPAKAQLVKASTGGVVEVNEGFDRAWRRVGLALDRVGFTVEDRDRSKGLYYVRYVDPNAEAQTKAASEKGLLSRLFSFGSDDKAKSAQRYQVAVKEAGSVTRVGVLNAEGGPDNSQTAERILSLLNEQLK